MARNTRQRILIAALLLFNEKGVGRTSLNEIADEIDISPGNLHYHFKKKSDIVDGLVAEFQADARTVLHAPDHDELSLDDFWLFLHLLLEFTAAYRFMLRDTESLAADYPKVGRTLRHFARGLDTVFQVYLLGLAAKGELQLDVDAAAEISRNLAVIALLSERFDELLGETRDAEDASLHVARSILGALRPLATADAAAHLEELATHYTE
jgi:AcrR family transcriptional regulator